MLARWQLGPGNCKCWTGFGHMAAPGISQPCVKPLLAGLVITSTIKARDMMLLGFTRPFWSEKALYKAEVHRSDNSPRILRLLLHCQSRMSRSHFHLQNSHKGLDGNSPFASWMQSLWAMAAMIQSCLFILWGMQLHAHTYHNSASSV